MSPSRVFLGLGSNLGARLRLLREALRLIEQANMHIQAVSHAYETKAVGPDQPDYLNAVARVSTKLRPQEILAAVKHIEVSLGRVPTGRWGPRPIDIDILLYDDLVVATPDLQIPHPRMAQRSFVTVPLLEVEPEIAAWGIDLSHSQELSSDAPRIFAELQTPGKRF